MRTLCTIAILSFLLFSAGCGSANKKNDPSIKGARADKGITVKDEAFQFKDLKKVILYNEVDNEDSNAILYGIAGELQKRNIEAVIDTGESMNYEGERFRIITVKDLLSVYFKILILKPGGKKGNEETIAEIKADSVAKLVEITMGFICSQKNQ